MRRSPHLRNVLCAAIPATALLASAQLFASSPAIAATLTFGSQLSVPATLDTAENLNYEGTDIPVPGSVFHINHDGADTLLWNIAQPQGLPTAPSGGQVIGVSLEGCARQPAGAPAPLTQIHFQDLTPMPDGGVHINLTSGAFDIPVCGAGGAGGSTVTSYAPVNFCVSQGDYVGFNDEGGFVGAEGLPPYPAGVPYQVIGSVAGATMDSFIRNGGTNNGTSISPSDRTYHDGFASNANEELLLQATLATGADASDSCPGGTKSSYVPPTSGYSQKPSPPFKVGPQTDGINHRGVVAVAVYCHQASGCKGSLSLVPLGTGRRASTVRAPFSIPGGKTSHVSVRLPAKLVKLAKSRGRKGLSVSMTVTTGSTTVTQKIVVKVY